MAARLSTLSPHPRVSSAPSLADQIVAQVGFGPVGGLSLNELADRLWPGISKATLEVWDTAVWYVRWRVLGLVARGHLASQESPAGTRYVLPALRSIAAAALLMVGFPGCAAELPTEVAYSVRHTAPSGTRTAISGTARCGAYVITEVEGVVADSGAGEAAWLRRAEKACGGETTAGSALVPQILGNIWDEGKGAAQ